MIRLPSCPMPPLHVAALALGLGAGSCVPPPAPRNTDQAARQACRQRADDIYAQQNRVNLYRGTNSDTPYGASGLPSDTSAGLSQRYGYETIVDNCLRGSEANTELGSGRPGNAQQPSPRASRPAGAEPLATPAPGAPLSAPPPLIPAR